MLLLFEEKKTIMEKREWFDELLFVFRGGAD